MRKALRIISISAGIISVLSAAILAFIYLEDVIKHFNVIKAKFLPPVEELEQIEE